MTTDGGGVEIPANKVLISYAHTGKVPKKVATLAKMLREMHKIDVVIDQYMKPGGPPEGWPQWMDRMVREAAFIVCVCTPNWTARVQGQEQLDIGHGVAWEGRLLNGMLYGAKGVTDRLVLVQLEGEEFVEPDILKGRHVHRLPRDIADLVATLQRKQAPVPKLGARTTSTAGPADYPARRAELVGDCVVGQGIETTQIAQPVVEVVDPAAAFAEAVELLEAALADDKLAAVVRRALRDPPAGLAAHLRDMTASEVVDALNQLHAELTKAGKPADARHVERAVLLLLPFLGDWARLLTVARRATGLQVDLPLVDLTLAEVLLAGADGRPCHFKLRGDDLEPAQLVLLTAARRAYRDRPETLAKLIQQSMERRAPGSVYDGVAELLGESAFVEDLDQLAHAVRGDAHPSQGVSVAADPAALKRLDQKMYADRSTKVAEDRRCWSLVIADERAAVDGQLWTLVCSALGPLRGLRLVRLSGDHDIDDFDLGVSLEHLSKMKLRSSP